MFIFQKPRIVVSKCIEFEHCRWNGLIISSDVVKQMKPFVEFLPVCPEVEIGLGVPREPVRVVAGPDGGTRLYQPATERDRTAEMQGFAARFLDGLPEVEGFVLKSRSPSCGLKEVQVHPTTEGGRPRNIGRGLFADAVVGRFPGVPREDEGRLTNFRLRETYLTHVFTLREWRDVAAEGTMGALVRFHTRHKLLFMVYRETAMRELGQVVANHEDRPVAEVFAAYRAGLRRVFERPAAEGPAINVLQHALGYFPLTAPEKAFFLAVLEDFRAGRVPLSVPASLVRSWIVRFGQEYLEGQSFFQPYPEGLVQISDSGKGRDL